MVKKHTQKSYREPAEIRELRTRFMAFIFEKR